MAINHAKVFSAQLRNVIDEKEMSQRQFAIGIGYGEQYLSDILRGKRTPSVRFVDAVCDYLKLGPTSRWEWHVYGAKCHGWNI